LNSTAYSPFVSSVAVAIGGDHGRVPLHPSQQPQRFLLRWTNGPGSWFTVFCRPIAPDFAIWTAQNWPHSLPPRVNRSPRSLWTITKLLPGCSPQGKRCSCTGMTIDRRWAGDSSADSAG
jgi:hypothetical protein